MSDSNIITATHERVRAATACPNCQSPVGVRCTQPTDHGRRFVDWVHAARWDAYDHLTETLARITTSVTE